MWQEEDFFIYILFYLYISQDSLKTWSWTKQSAEKSCHLSVKNNEEGKNRIYSILQKQRFTLSFGCVEFMTILNSFSLPAKQTMATAGFPLNENRGSDFTLVRSPQPHLCQTLNESVQFTGEKIILASQPKLHFYYFWRPMKDVCMHVYSWIR